MQQKNYAESGALSSTEQTVADTHLPSTGSRNAGGLKPSIRENMILNRRALTKPLTAKASFANGKRAQSGVPGAANRIAVAATSNRLYQRNMTNAQSYNYERGGVIASS